MADRPVGKTIDVIFGARRKTSRPVSGMNRGKERCSDPMEKKNGALLDPTQVLLPRFRKLIVSR